MHLGGGMIELIPMNQVELKEYLNVAIRNYASEKVKSGNWREEDAAERSEKEYASLLPKGVETEGHHLFTIRDVATGRKVGMIWFGNSGAGDEIDGAWIWDFLIYEEERGKGFGKEALKELDRILLGLGQKKISLQVFGHNEVAIHIYNASGYKVTNLVMSKNLG